MKEFIEKLIGRLEEYPHGKYEDEYGKGFSNGINVAIEEVNELAEEYGKDTNVTTNADKIRGMTDEELAEFFEKLEVVCDMCAFKVGCCNIAPDNCKSGLLKWLQSEVEGVTENE